MLALYPVVLSLAIGVQALPWGGWSHNSVAPAPSVSSSGVGEVVAVRSTGSESHQVKVSRSSEAVR